MAASITPEPDKFGWFHIQHKGETLQSFRTEKECRQWLSDCASIFRALGLYD